MDLQQIKLKAAEVRNQYNPSGLVPFPFADMASRLGVDLFVLANAPERISGAIFFQEGRFSIIINQQKPEVRQYFTTAHEFGHYFLHQDWLRANPTRGFVDYSDQLDVDGMLLRPDDPSTLPDIDLQKEREANNFAADLIMPLDKVKEYWDLTHDIAATAKAFQVSQTAMAVRLDKLGFIS